MIEYRDPDSIVEVNSHDWRLRSAVVVEYLLWDIDVRQVI